MQDTRKNIIDEIAMIMAGELINLIRVTEKIDIALNNNIIATISIEDVENEND